MMITILLVTSHLPVSIIRTSVLMWWRAIISRARLVVRRAILTVWLPLMAVWLPILAVWLPNWAVRRATRAIRHACSRKGQALGAKFEVLDYLGWAAIDSAARFEGCKNVCFELRCTLKNRTVWRCSAAFF